MKQTFVGSTPLSCSAELTVKRNSIKKYFDSYYLQNGQEFELLLKNTTQDTVIATIEINGKRISSSAIVLKPGQKVYLERYLDDNKKFLFETYEVDNTPGNQLAIANNGKVRIAFYKEKQAPVLKPSQVTDWFDMNNITYGGVYNGGYSGQSGISISSSFTANSLMAQQPRGISKSLESKSKVSQDSLETGMVGKGSISNQEFKNYQGEFESIAFKVVAFKIYPQSAKPLDVSDLATYCTQCGTKNKKGNYKFCPKCGNKF